MTQMHNPIIICTQYLLTHHRPAVDFLRTAPAHHNGNFASGIASTCGAKFEFVFCCWNNKQQGKQFFTVWLCPQPFHNAKTMCLSNWEVPNVGRGLWQIDSMWTATGWFIFPELDSFASSKIQFAMKQILLGEKVKFLDKMLLLWQQEYVNNVQNTH